MNDPHGLIGPIVLLGRCGLDRLAAPLRALTGAEVIVSGFTDAALVGPLLARLGDPKERSGVRFKAVEALSAARDPAALPALIAALGDADSAVRSTAAWCLGVFRAPEAYEPLVAYLFADMDGEYAHAGAAISLGLSGDPRALAPLKRALDDEREAVRQWAAEGLGHLKLAQAVPPLVLALEDVSEAVRESAARALRPYLDEHPDVLVRAVTIGGQPWELAKSPVAAQLLGRRGRIPMFYALDGEGEVIYEGHDVERLMARVDRARARQSR